MRDSFATRSQLEVAGQSYAYASLPPWASASTWPACPIR